MKRELEPRSVNDSLRETSTKSCVLALGFLLLAFIGPGMVNPLPDSLHSQELSDEYQARNDEYDPRHEGIRDVSSVNVTEDKIALLSALMLTSASLGETLPDVLKLGFFTPAATPMSISIFHQAERYYVTPLRDQWGPGLSVFKWPANIMRRRRIRGDGLFARAVFVEHGERSLFPACLYSGESADTVTGYSFVVAPLQKMALHWWIMEAQSEAIVATGQAPQVQAHEQFFIRWDGGDDRNFDVAEIDYVLKIEGKFKPPFGRSRTVSMSYQFTHRPTLSN